MRSDPVWLPRGSHSLLSRSYADPALPYGSRQFVVEVDESGSHRSGNTGERSAAATRERRERGVLQLRSSEKNHSVTPRIDRVRGGRP